MRKLVLGLEKKNWRETYRSAGRHSSGPTTRHPRIRPSLANILEQSPVPSSSSSQDECSARPETSCSSRCHPHEHVAGPSSASPVPFHRAPHPMKRVRNISTEEALNSEGCIGEKTDASLRDGRAIWKRLEFQANNDPAGPLKVRGSDATRYSKSASAQRHRLRIGGWVKAKNRHRD